MKLYNTLTRQKEEFVPITPGEVKMYSCGPTVYNYFHVGNARPFIIFDLLRCYLEYRGYKVKFVQNFTDIDDKVINKANEEGVDFNTIAERYIKEYYVDAQGLGVKKASVHPRATETMDAIIDIVERLIENGHAYVAENGDVYFRTKSFPEYGKLCHQPMEELQAGARISVGEVKEDPMDFAVWKAAKPGEPAWDTPWGSKGRPGWHIECSAMANKYLGKTIDIHSGGLDLIFPHHENEIAQSECANGCTFAHYWLHNGFLTIDNEKMSKSKGNFFMVRDAAKQFGYETIRMFMLSAHYRTPLNYSAESLEMNKASLARLYEARNNMEFRIEKASGDTMTAEETAKRLMENKFDMNDMLEQFAQIRKMGGAGVMLSMLPGASGIDASQIDEKAFDRIEAMIYSMTKEEREKPSIINPKRKRRIAAGSGTRVEDVNKLLKQYEMMQKMMKQFKKSPKGFARRLGGMMGNPNAFRGLK